MPLNLPFPVFGSVTNSTGATVSSALVKIRNETTGELITATTNANGQYVQDANNFSSGYLNSDKITAYVLSANEEGSNTLTVSSGISQLNIALSSITDSSLINYISVQDVYDYLDSLTTTDIAPQKLIKFIRKAEAEVEKKTRTKFTSTTVTQEIYDFHQYNSYHGPEQLEGRGYAGRRDFWSLAYKNIFRLFSYPVISMTTLQKNNNGGNESDSWETLTEQTGSGGDFVVDKPTGWIKFIKNVPRYGTRALRITYVHGYSTVPEEIKRLVILLTVKDIIISKQAGGLFSAPNSVSIAGMSITAGTATAYTFLDTVNKELESLWGVSGSFVTDIV